MKKIFSLFVAVVAAMSINAAAINVDLSAAAGYAHHDDDAGAVSLADGVLTVNWTVGTGWSVAGTEIALGSVEGITKVTFDYIGDGGGTTMYVYFRDSEGNRWWSESGFGLNVQDWTASEMVPVSPLWDAPTYSYGEHPIVSIGMIANPASPTSGTFQVRNMKIYNNVPMPETAPAAPSHAEEDVMAMYCNHYTTNNVNFNILGWGGVQTWETLNIDGTNILYCQDMTWDMMTNWDNASYDFSAFEKFHFDVWVPEARHLKVVFEAASGWKKSIDFNLNAGWNTIDADPTWWITEEAPYNWTDVKYVGFEGYKMADGETSAEGTPFAFANLYWWKSPAVVYPEAPALPTKPEEAVMALFCPAYTTNTVNFGPQNWGGAGLTDVEGKFFYTGAMSWDAFTNWDADHYDMSAYDMFACDIYVEQTSSLKFTFEALGVGDGGSGWKNGLVVENLQANQWNHVELDLLNAPYQSYEFTDVRYLILEGYSHEGTPLGIANAYFYDSMYQGIENTETKTEVIKRIENGQLIIERNGIKYNAQGTQF